MFIATKWRLIPSSQKISIPRLELQVTVIVTRLKNTIVKEIPIEEGNTFFMDRFENSVKLSQQ